MILCMNDLPWNTTGQRFNLDNNLKHLLLLITWNLTIVLVSCSNAATFFLQKDAKQWCDTAKLDGNHCAIQRHM